MNNIRNNVTAFAPHQRDAIVLETLARLNASLASNSNALVLTREGNVDPEHAYIELVREIVALR